MRRIKFDRNSTSKPGLRWQFFSYLQKLARRFAVVCPTRRAFSRLEGYITPPYPPGVSALSGTRVHGNLQVTTISILRNISVSLENPSYKLHAIYYCSCCNVFIALVAITYSLLGYSSKLWKFS